MESANSTNDFRSISLLPQRCDLKHEDNFLQPSIIDGGYSSVDHYLDVQFRLLREDFLHGLRVGIGSYLTDKTQSSYENIRVFQDVKFLKLMSDLDNTGYLVQLQSKEIKNRESYDDMFMFGSLLVFTCDNFKNVLISTVVNSDNRLLNKGQILVTIPIDHFSHFSIDDFYMNNFIMIESEVYFEPYYHVLKALQHKDLAINFPMKKYIIDAKDSRALPSYIRQSQSNVLLLPEFSKVNLNSSQCDAYEMALTREFVVIQGPPGTGKTHLGLKVAKAVLANGNRVKPMLVICFTNHALDQFLEGLLKVTNDIVRIGGRSKSEKLEAYNLSKLRKDNPIKMLPKTYATTIKPLKSTVKELVKIEESLKSENHNEDMEKDLKNRFTELLVLYKKHAQKYKQYKLEKDRTLLSNAKVIGMTTTGAARLQPLLRSLQVPIVIVEEAAEVLEAHIIASLTKHCKHLILIGDHKQLQPSSASYRLGQKYNLEISLFERMITNGIHSKTLNVQHRMRPEIAALIAPAIYEDLRNHPSVERFPQVKGLKKNVYFINHKVHEDTKRGNDTNHSNRYEAHFLIRLAIYLLQQGYKAEMITILATYKGQMILLKNLALKRDVLEDVLITTVDSYQGEENKIILLSLVRCNKSNSIGFLARENRVCVALSRAREGFYLIGNMDALRKKSDLWKKIGISLEQQDAVSPALPLMCHYHPNVVTMVSNGKDFDNIPDGLCYQFCGVVIKCGHTCSMVCHECDKRHTNIKCLEPCKRTKCQLQHPCPRKCYEKCTACLVMVTITLLCKHSMKVQCYMQMNSVICRQPCVRRNAQCSVENKNKNHMCKKMCFQACDPCPVVVSKKRSYCSHIVNVPCHKSPDGTNCEIKCDRTISSCGHKCNLMCYEKCLCYVKVSKKRSYCSHIVNVPCHKSPDETECGIDCDRTISSCGHKCTLKCYENCLCYVEVSKKRSYCSHVINVACYKRPDETICQMECDRTISCGHKCTLICFQKCFCYVKVTKKSINCPHLVTLQCYQGPSRKYCVAECTRSLICGHPCTQDCRDECDASLCQEMVASISWMKNKNRFLLPCHIKQRGLFSIGFISYSCKNLLSILFRKKIIVIASVFCGFFFINFLANYIKIKSIRNTSLRCLVHNTCYNKRMYFPTVKWKESVQYVIGKIT